jgi:hypothetical protein
MINKPVERKIKIHHGLKDYYKFYKSKYPDSELTHNQFSKVFRMFNLELAKRVVEDRGVKLPFGFGSIDMVKIKKTVYENDEGVIVNRKPVDFKATKNLWESNKEAKDKKILIRHNNIHSDGYTFRIWYNKKYCNYKYKSFYFFKPVRKFSRSVTKRVFDLTKSKYDAPLKFKEK